MTPPRTGPQGVSMDDLRRVTGRITRLQPGGPRPLPTQQIVSNLVGGPLPTYGKKYGGFTTQEQQVNAIIGQAQVLAQAQALAEEQAAMNRANLYGATQFQPRSPADYARLQAEQNRISNVLAQPVTPAPTTRDQLYGKAGAYQNAQQQLANLYAQPEFFADRASQAEATREDIRALRGAVGDQPMSWFGRALAERKANEAARNESYGRQMERMNAIAFRQPSEEQRQMAAASYELGRDAAGNLIAPFVPTVTTQEIATQGLGTPLSGEALRTTVYPAEQTARDLAGTSRAEFAQMLATGRYGMDPGLAAGLFGPEFGAEQRLREQGTEFTQPGQSIDEYILLNQGPAALEQYQANRVQEALKKQEEGFRTADEEALDLQLEQQTGVNVKAAAGDYSLSTARGYLTNPEFMNQLRVGRDTVNSADALTVEDKKTAAAQVAQDYYKQTGDAVGAQILLNALVSFTFTFGFDQFSL